MKPQRFVDDIESPPPAPSGLTFEARLLKVSQEEQKTKEFEADFNSATWNLLLYGPLKDAVLFRNHGGRFRITIEPINSRF